MCVDAKHDAGASLSSIFGRQPTSPAATLLHTSPLLRIYSTSHFLPRLKMLLYRLYGALGRCIAYFYLNPLHRIVKSWAIVCAMAQTAFMDGGIAFIFYTLRYLLSTYCFIGFAKCRLPFHWHIQRLAGQLPMCRTYTITPLRL